MQIEVTQEDINKGVKSDCNKCPIAQSLIRMGKGKVYVDSESACFDEESYYLPGKAMQFIWDFDAGRSVGPVEFTLEVSVETSYAESH